MKYILEIRNYECNKLFVDTDTMEFALDDYHYDEDFQNSEVYEFQKKFNDWNGHNYAPVLLLQRKKDFYEFIEALKENGYTEIKFKLYREHEHEYNME